MKYDMSYYATAKPVKKCKCGNGIYDINNNLCYKCKLKEMEKKQEK